MVRQQMILLLVLMLSESCQGTDTSGQEEDKVLVVAKPSVVMVPPTPAELAVTGTVFGGTMLLVYCTPIGGVVTMGLGSYGLLGTWVAPYPAYAIAAKTLHASIFSAVAASSSTLVGSRIVRALITKKVVTNATLPDCDGSQVSPSHPRPPGGDCVIVQQVNQECADPPPCEAPQADKLLPQEELIDSQKQPEEPESGEEIESGHSKVSEEEESSRAEESLKEEKSGVEETSCREDTSGTKETSYPELQLVSYSVIAVCAFLLGVLTLRGQRHESRESDVELPSNKQKTKIQEGYREIRPLIESRKLGLSAKEIAEIAAETARRQDQLSLQELKKLLDELDVQALFGESPSRTMSPSNLEVSLQAVHQDLKVVTAHLTENNASLLADPESFFTSLKTELQSLAVKQMAVTRSQFSEALQEHAAHSGHVIQEIVSGLGKELLQRQEDTITSIRQEVAAIEGAVKLSQAQREEVSQMTARKSEQTLRQDMVETLQEHTSQMIFATESRLTNQVQLLNSKYSDMLTRHKQEMAVLQEKVAAGFGKGELGELLQQTRITEQNVIDVARSVVELRESVTCGTGQAEAQIAQLQEHQKAVDARLSGIIKKQDLASERAEEVLGHVGGLQAVLQETGKAVEQLALPESTLDSIGVIQSSLETLTVRTDSIATAQGRMQQELCAKFVDVSATNKEEDASQVKVSWKVLDALSNLSDKVDNVSQQVNDTAKKFLLPKLDQVAESLEAAAEDNIAQQILEHVGRIPEQVEEHLSKTSVAASVQVIKDSVASLPEFMKQQEEQQKVATSYLEQVPVLAEKLEAHTNSNLTDRGLTSKQIKETLQLCQENMVPQVLESLQGGAIEPLLQGRVKEITTQGGTQVPELEIQIADIVEPVRKIQESVEVLPRFIKQLEKQHLQVSADLEKVSALADKVQDTREPLVDKISRQVDETLRQQEVKTAQVLESLQETHNIIELVWNRVADIAKESQSRVEDAAEGSRFAQMTERIERIAEQLENLSETSGPVQLIHEKVDELSDFIKHQEKRNNQVDAHLEKLSAMAAASTNTEEFKEPFEKISKWVECHQTKVAQILESLRSDIVVLQGRVMEVSSQGGMSQEVPELVNSRALDLLDAVKSLETAVNVMGGSRTNDVEAISRIADEVSKPLSEVQQTVNELQDAFRAGSCRTTELLESIRSSMQAIPAAHCDNTADLLNELKAVQEELRKQSEEALQEEESFMHKRTEEILALVKAVQDAVETLPADREQSQGLSDKTEVISQRLEKDIALSQETLDTIRTMKETLQTASEEQGSEEMSTVLENLQKLLQLTQEQHPKVAELLEEISRDLKVTTDNGTLQPITTRIDDMTEQLSELLGSKNKPQDEVLRAVNLLPKEVKGDIEKVHVAVLELTGLLKKDNEELAPRVWAGCKKDLVERADLQAGFDSMQSVLNGFALKLDNLADQERDHESTIDEVGGPLKDINVNVEVIRRNTEKLLDQYGRPAESVDDPPLRPAVKIVPTLSLKKAEVLETFPTQRSTARSSGRLLEQKNRLEILRRYYRKLFQKFVTRRYTEVQRDISLAGLPALQQCHEHRLLARYYLSLERFAEEERQKREDEEEDMEDELLFSPQFGTPVKKKSDKEMPMPVTPPLSMEHFVELEEWHPTRVQKDKDIGGSKGSQLGPRSRRHSVPTDFSTDFVEGIFKRIDKNGDGRIDQGELNIALRDDPEVRNVFSIPAAKGGPNCHLSARVWQRMAEEGVAPEGAKSITWKSFSTHFAYLASPSSSRTRVLDPSRRSRRARGYSYTNPPSPSHHLTPPKPRVRQVRSKSTPSTPVPRQAE